MASHDLAAVAHVALAFLLTYLLGFERDLRGAPAGDRTFSLIGVGAAIVAVLAKDGNAPNALAGVITGIGFIGAGVVFRPSFRDGVRRGSDTVRGVTTAATIFVAAAIGASAGQGRLTLAIGGTALSLLALEIRHLPGLKLADGRRWASHFQNDDDPIDGIDGADGLDYPAGSDSSGQPGPSDATR